MRIEIMQENPWGMLGKEAFDGLLCQKNSPGSLCYSYPNFGVF
jgi:hypothetical protein